MRILIIGGNGFLGTYLAKALIKKKHKVTIYDLKDKNVFNENVKTIKGSINDIDKLNTAIKNKDVVYNYAAISDIEESSLKPLDTIKVNILGNANVLNLCVKYNVKKFIFGSSIYVHSSQGSFYKATKQSSELIIHEYFKKFKLNYTILRFGTIYGPGSGLNNGLNKMIRNAFRRKRLIYFGSKKAKRRFIHISDSTDASIEILKNKYINKNVLITGNKLISIPSALRLIGITLNIKNKPIYMHTKNESHYNSSPFNYKPKKDMTLFINPKINIKNGILELIKVEKSKLR